MSVGKFGHILVDFLGNSLDIINLDQAQKQSRKSRLMDIEDDEEDPPALYAFTDRKQQVHIVCLYIIIAVLCIAFVISWATGRFSHDPSQGFFCRRYFPELSSGLREKRLTVHNL
jgi:hypothetical protein